MDESLYRMYQDHLDEVDKEIEEREALDMDEYEYEKYIRGWRENDELMK